MRGHHLTPQHHAAQFTENSDVYVDRATILIFNFYNFGQTLASKEISRATNDGI